MAEVFISYSRRDTPFVRRMAASLEGRGKTVWLDTEGIADTEVFSQAIRVAIEGSEAFLFVITPASVTSEFCDQEVTYARSLEKRIVPVLRVPVADPEIPEEIRTRNWIPFSEDDDFESSLERVVRALDTDLALRKEHTRWLVKSLEWDGKERDRSLLLRGDELRAAEEWFARVNQDSDPAPTELQVEYLLASRKANVRRGRVVVAASLTVAVLAVGVGVLALLSRNQAVSASNTARSQTLAADSENELSSDPEVSVLLGRRAVQDSATPQAMAALRQALDASAVRVALPTEPGGECGFDSGPSAVVSPDGRQVAESLCTGDIDISTASGHVVVRRHVASQASAVAYSPDGTALAVGTKSGVDLLDASSGERTRGLSGHGEPNALAFSPGGEFLAATTSDGVSLWDLGSGSQMWSIPGPDEDRTAAFTSDGQDLVVGTNLGYSMVVDVATGQVVRTLAPPSTQSAATGGVPDPVAVRGIILVVGVDSNGPDDTSGDVDLWNTQTWTLYSAFTSVTGASVTSVALSPDEKKIAVGLVDGTGGVWSVVPDDELFSFEGQSARINSVSFSPDSDRVVATDNNGVARIYRTEDPWLKTLPVILHSCDEEFAWQPHKLLALVQQANDIAVQAWQLPSFRPISDPTVVDTHQSVDCSAISPDGTLVALWNGDASSSPVRVVNVATHKVVRTLPTMPIEGLSFSSDDRLLAVATGEGGLDVASLSYRHTVVSHGWPKQCPLTGDGPPVISADDQLVAAYSLCGQVEVGRTSTAKPFESFDEHESVESAAFSPVHDELALASLDGSVTVLNVDTDQRVLDLLGPSRQATGVAFSSDGHYVVATSYDDTVRIWNATSGQLLRVDHDFSFTYSPSISPNGQFLVEFNEDNQTNVWSACPDCEDPDALLGASRASIVSPLTPIEHAQFASSTG